MERGRRKEAKYWGRTPTDRGVRNVLQPWSYLRGEKISTDEKLRNLKKKIRNGNSYCK